MQLLMHTAPPASALATAGSARPVAGRLAFGRCVPEAALLARAQAVGLDIGAAGKVQARGSWRDPRVHAQLCAALGVALAPAVRSDLEWYTCRGAFFHNDAHYEARLFGVWCIAGPESEIVFPRAALRLPAGPGSIAVFDPFEVHGVLAPGRTAYEADDYHAAEPSVFVGFELDISAGIAETFAILGRPRGRVISSRTRIDSATGAIDSFG